MSEEIKEFKGKLVIYDETEKLVHMRMLKENEYNSILRLLELVKDKETVDEVVKALEAPKKAISLEIAEKIGQAKDFKEVLAEALIVLSKADLEEISKRLGELQFERKTDCIIIKTAEKSWVIPI